MKTIFKGMGYEKASTCGDVGNCRIRAIIDTPRGEMFIELSSVEISKYSTTPLKKQFNIGDIAGHINHAFLLKDKETNHSEELGHINLNLSFAWNKKEIIRIVNKLFGSKINDFDVCNDGSYDLPGY